MHTSTGGPLRLGGNGAPLTATFGSFPTRAACRFAYRIIPKGRTSYGNTLTAAATTALLVREGWSLAIARTPQDAALAMGSPHMSKRLARHTARPVTAADFLRDNDVRFRCGPTRRLGALSELRCTRISAPRSTADLTVMGNLRESREPNPSSSVRARNGGS
jgi:hypothetical protein